MGEIEEGQERRKADMQAMKEKMATMMEAMMSIKRIMEVNAAAVAATSAIVEVDPTPPSSLNQINHLTSDVVGQEGKELGSIGDPHFVQVQNTHAFPPYGLPPNYTTPNVAHTPNENVNNSTTILVESRQPQSNHAHVSQPMGETHEIPHHNLADFEPCIGCATEGQAIGGVPLSNTLEGPRFCPQPQPFYFAVGRVPPAMAENGKLDHIEERLRAVEGGEDYAFADMEDLCLVPDKAKGLHVLTFRGLHILTFKGLHALAFIGLHTLAFRGLHVLIIRGLHILAIRGLHILAFRGLHDLTFKGLHVLAFRRLRVLTFKGLHALAFIGLHLLALRALHALAFIRLHTFAFRGLHILAFRGLNALAFIELHALTF